MPSGPMHHLPRKEAPSVAQKRSSVHRSADVSSASFNTELEGAGESSPACGRWVTEMGQTRWHVDPA